MRQYFFEFGIFDVSHIFFTWLFSGSSSVWRRHLKSWLYAEQVLIRTRLGRLQRTHDLLNLQLLDERGQSERVKRNLFDDTQLARAGTKALENLRLHRLQVLSFQHSYFFSEQ